MRGFMHIVQYRRNQDAAARDAALDARGAAADTAAARAGRSRGAGRRARRADRARGQGGARGLRHPRRADRASCSTAEAARGARRAIGFPVALKILSPDITPQARRRRRRARPGDDAEAVREAARERCSARSARAAPGARIDGFMVQPMVKRPHAHELIVGAAEDPVFGPDPAVRPWRHRGRGDRRQGARPCRRSTWCWPRRW